VTAPAGILLAAGRSRRLGREKQLLSVKGKTLLRLVAEEVTACAAPVVVVLPAGRSEFAGELEGLAATVLRNPDPGSGMGDSLALAARSLLAVGSVSTGVVVALIDQPLADRSLFEALERAAAAGDGYSACDYGGGAWGVPARFPASALPELATLSGDRGAKGLLEPRRAAGRLPLVSFPGGSFDVDSEADYERLLLELEGSGSGSAGS
jgi:molybdenum cofactor cytidylyltransferase